MGTIWALAISLFLVVTLLVMKFFKGFIEKESSEKMRKNWRARMYYWHFVLMISGGATTLIIFLLKWGNVLTFQKFKALVNSLKSKLILIPSTVSINTMQQIKK